MFLTRFDHAMVGFLDCLQQVLEILNIFLIMYFRLLFSSKEEKWLVDAVEQRALVSIYLGF